MAENVQTKETVRRLPDRVTIEMNEERNRQVLFHPTQDRLRGRWELARLGPTAQSSHGLYEIPTIPGMCVTVDTRRKIGSITDPLNLPENSDLRNQVWNSTKAMTGQPHGPVKNVERELSDSEMASWLYWMWRHVRAKQATVLAGEILNETELIKAMPQASIKKNYLDDGGAGIADRNAILIG